MKDFKLNPLAVSKVKAVKLFLSSGLVITSSIGLTGCGGNNVKPKDTQPPTEDVVEPVEPEKTPEELEAESLQDFQIVPDGKTYNNEILERYNKIQGFRYIVNPGRDEYEVVEFISPTEEGLAKLQENGKYYQFIESVIYPCYFVNTSGYGWLKKYNTNPEETDALYYHTVKEEYKYATDEYLNEIFGTKEKQDPKQFTLTK